MAKGKYSLLSPEEGDVIEVEKNPDRFRWFLRLPTPSNVRCPEYIQVDYNSMKGSFMRTPGLADVPYPVLMEPNLVIEFYSR